MCSGAAPFCREASRRRAAAKSVPNIFFKFPEGILGRKAGEERHLHFAPFLCIFALQCGRPAVGFPFFVSSARRKWFFYSQKQGKRKNFLRALQFFLRGYEFFLQASEFFFCGMLDFAELIFVKVFSSEEDFCSDASVLFFLFHHPTLWFFLRLSGTAAGKNRQRPAGREREKLGKWQRKSENRSTNKCKNSTKISG